MKRIVISAFAVLAVCALPILIAGPLQAAPPGQHVLVVNGAGQPVPVSIGAPVSVAGTVPVSIAAPVTVAGTVLTAPASTPLRISSFQILSIAAGSREARLALYTVPAGKRLLIESETAMLHATNGVKPHVTIEADNTTGGALFYAIMPQVERGWWDGQGQLFEGSSAIPMFADPGQAVTARIWLNTDTAGGTVRAEIGISGYLVDAP